VTRLQYDWHTEKSYFPNANEVITLWYSWLHNVNVDNGTMTMITRFTDYSGLTFSRN